MQSERTPLPIYPAQLVLGIGLLVVVYAVLLQFADIGRTGHLLLSSSWIWVTVGVVAMSLSMLLGSVAQWLAAGKVGRLHELVELKLAGSLLNHFLPFSLGEVGLVTAYYRHLRMSRSRAVVVATLPLAVGAVVTTGLIMVFAPVAFLQLIDTLRQKYIAPSVITGLGAAGLAAAVVAYVLRKRFVAGARQLTITLREAKGWRLMTSLGLATLAQALTAAIVLYASVYAIGGSVSLLSAITIFVASMLTGEAAPTPGGIGAVEAVVIVGLVGAGLAASDAIAAVIVFRFVSYVLPILPGVAVIGMIPRLIGRSSRSGEMGIE